MVEKRMSFTTEVGISFEIYEVGLMLNWISRIICSFGLNLAVKVVDELSGKWS